MCYVSTKRKPITSTLLTWLIHKKKSYGLTTVNTYPPIRLKPRNPSLQSNKSSTLATNYASVTHHVYSACAMEITYHIKSTRLMHNPYKLTTIMHTNYTITRIIHLAYHFTMARWKKSRQCNQSRNVLSQHVYPSCNVPQRTLDTALKIIMHFDQLISRQ